MPDQLAVSCRLCLRADERESMIAINVQLTPGAPEVDVLICLRCAREAAARLALSDFAQAVEVENHDPDANRSATAVVVADPLSDAGDRNLPGGAEPPEEPEPAVDEKVVVQEPLLRRRPHSRAE
jgi:hypothetical protein